eukprot:5106804-Lingulodinium_polyedra.AAC.1
MNRERAALNAQFQCEREELAEQVHQAEALSAVYLSELVNYQEAEFQGTVPLPEVPAALSPTNAL